MTCLICMVLLSVTVVVQAQNIVELVVPLNETFQPADILAAIPGATIPRQYSIGPGCQLALVTVSLFGRDPTIDNLQTKPKFAYSPNYRVDLSASHSAASSGECQSQTTGTYKWGLTRISSRDKPSYSDDETYKYNDTGECVDIYVLDSGVNVEHETFGGRARVGYTAEEVMELEGERDVAGHGTHVAGLAAGSLHGTAKKANVISVKVFSFLVGAKLSWFFEGLEWIANHIAQKADRKRLSVINMSLVVRQTSFTGDLGYMEKCLRNIPAVIVVGAGNKNTDACTQYPARFPDVITVAGTDRDDKLFQKNVTAGSNHGKCIDIIAPGYKIVSASHRDNRQDNILSGTSMSTGYVSGLVARLLQCNSLQPNTSDVREWLQKIATKGKTNAADTQTPDFLLYASCDTESVPPVTTPATTTTTSTTTGPSRSNVTQSLANSTTALPGFQAAQLQDFASSLKGSLIIAGVGVFVLGVVIGVAALIRARRKRNATMQEQKILGKEDNN